MGVEMSMYMHGKVNATDPTIQDVHLIQSGGGIDRESIMQCVGTAIISAENESSGDACRGED